MATKTNKKAKPTQFIIGPTLTIDNIADIKAEFLKATKGNKKVDIKSEPIENIDLSGIQLLLWLKKDVSLKKSIEAIKFNESAIELVSKCGFSKHFNN